MQDEKTPLQKWTEYIAQSRGTALFLPDEFKEEAKAIEKRRKDFNVLLNTIVAEKEIDLQVETQNLFHKIRKHLKKIGKEDIFIKDIGWNMDAVEEGIYVINIIAPPKAR